MFTSKLTYHVGVA